MLFTMGAQGAVTTKKATRSLRSMEDTNMNMENNKEEQDFDLLNVHAPMPQNNMKFDLAIVETDSGREEDTDISFAVEDELDELEDQLEEINEGIKDAKGEKKKELEEKQEELQQELKELKEELKEMEESLEKDMKERQKELNDSISEIEEELENIANETKEKVEAGMEEKQEEMKEEKNEISKEIKDTQASIAEELDDMTKDIEKEIDGLKENVDELAEELSTELRGDVPSPEEFEVIVTRHFENDKSIAKTVKKTKAKNFNMFETSKNLMKDVSNPSSYGGLSSKADGTYSCCVSSCEWFCLDIDGDCMEEEDVWYCVMEVDA